MRGILRTRTSQTAKRGDFISLAGLLFIPAAGLLENTQLIDRLNSFPNLGSDIIETLEVARLK